MVFFILLECLFAHFLFFQLLLLSVCFEPLVVCVYLLFGFATEHFIDECILLPECFLLRLAVCALLSGLGGCFITKLLLLGCVVTVRDKKYLTR